MRPGDRSGGRPALASKHRRRNSTRRLFKGLRSLGLVASDFDPCVDLPLPPRTSLAIRPLTDEEILECEWSSRSDFDATVYPAVWALAEAGATPAELAEVLVRDIDCEAGVVALGVDDVHARTKARLVPLNDWSRNQLGRHLAAAGLGELDHFAYGGHGPTSRKTTIYSTLSRIRVTTQPVG